MSYIYYKDKLSGDYWEVLDKAEIYGMTKISIDYDETEEMLMNLTDILLSAQQENKPIEKIIGNDVEDFCRNYFESYREEKRSLKSLTKRFVRIFWFIFVFGWIDMMIALTSKEAGSMFEIQTDAGPFLLGLLFGNMAVMLGIAIIKPFVFKSKWLNAQKAGFIMVVLDIAVLIAVVLLLGFLPDKFKIEVPLFPIILVSAAYLAFYYILKYAANWKKYGSIKEPEWEDESFWGKVIESVKAEMPAEFKKRFEKINKKNAQKNKPLITAEEFTEKIKKENKTTIRNVSITYGILTICIVLIAFPLISELSFAILWTAIFVICEILFYRFFMKSLKLAREVILHCEEEGITMIELAERIERESKEGEEENDREKNV